MSTFLGDHREQAASTELSLLGTYKAPIKTYVNQLWKPTQTGLCKKGSQRKASAITIPNVPGLILTGRQGRIF